MVLSERTWERKLKPPFTSSVTGCPSVNQFPDSLLCFRQCDGAIEMVKAISQGGNRTVNKYCHYEVKRAVTEFSPKRVGAANLSFPICRVGGSKETTTDSCCHSTVVVNKKE